MCVRKGMKMALDEATKSESKYMGGQKKRSLDMLWPECGHVRVFTRTELWGTCKKTWKN